MNEIQQEIVPITQDDLFVIMNHPNAKFDYPIHCHPEYEINLVMKTSGTRVVGDYEEAFSDLDIVMTGPYVPHVWKSDLLTNHVITIQFSSDLLSFQMINKRLFMPIRQLLVDSTQGLQFYGTEAERIRDEIMELTRIQGFQTATKFLTLLNFMAAAPRRKLVSNMYESENLVNSSESRRITKACKYIEENILFVEKFCKEELGWNAWSFTGLIFEQLPKEGPVHDFICELDALIDGPFILPKRDLSLKFRGSSNQRILHLKNGEIESIE